MATAAMSRLPTIAITISGIVATTGITVTIAMSVAMTGMTGHVTNVAAIINGAGTIDEGGS